MTTVLSRQCNWVGLSCYKIDVPVLKFKSQVNLIFEKHHRVNLTFHANIRKPYFPTDCISSLCLNFCLFLARQPPVGHGQVIHEVSRSHTTHHSWWDSSGRVINSSLRPLPVNTQHSQQVDIHTPGGIRTHNLSRWPAADPRLRPRGHRDWHALIFVELICYMGRVAQSV
jgi:hypothetical protein